MAPTSSTQKNSTPSAPAAGTATAPSAAPPKPRGRPRSAMQSTKGTHSPDPTQPPPPANSEPLATLPPSTTTTAQYAPLMNSQGQYTSYTSLQHSSQSAQQPQQSTHYAQPGTPTSAQQQQQQSPSALGMHHAPYSYTPQVHPHHAPSYAPSYHYQTNQPAATHHPSYPQHLMMYQPQSQSVPSQSDSPLTVGAKRKRSSLDPGARALSEEEPSEGEAVHHLMHTNAPPRMPTAAEMKKRTKTQRACDSCRSRKIRCDILAEADPPLCQHCKQYGFECTFFLPITETRFKKKRVEEDPSPTPNNDGEGTRRTASPKTDQPRGEVKVYGPTSAQHLFHSQQTVSPRIYESYDMRYHHSWEVSQTGDGLIQVFEPHTSSASPSGNSHGRPNNRVSIPRPPELRVDRDIIEKLVNAYFTEIAPLLPVVTQAEFLSTPAPPPILLYSMCLVAAARRDVSHSVFDSLRAVVSGLIRSEEVLSNASIVNVQALLVLSMCGDCHSQFVPNALSALWLRMGAAIRMAQDLGLHRAEAVKQDIESRRRIWAACVIADRWTSVTYGHPYMISVEDCDARLPSSGDANDLYLDELVRLSILLGRVMKTIYSPSGLTLATDEALTRLHQDLEGWNARLPDSLKYNGPQSSRHAGILHLLYACVCMIFWRVFMRISYSCPAHLKFALTIEVWTNLVRLTGEAIDWLDGHETVYDVWLPIGYAATSCALVQYHTWVRRKDEIAMSKLKTLRDCVRRWDQHLPQDQMSTRRKTAEICALLWEATQGPPLPLETRVLNPTGGVKAKDIEIDKALVYKKDSSRPGGGVFIAESRGGLKDFSDCPDGLIITKDDNAINMESSSLPSGTILDTFPSSTTHHDPKTGTPLNNGNSGMNVPAPSSTLVNFTPLGAPGFANVNPAMNESFTGPDQVQVMNVLDAPMRQSESLSQFAMADNGLLNGIPDTLFDWGQWESFFSRVAPPPAGSFPSDSNTSNI